MWVGANATTEAWGSLDESAFRGQYVVTRAASESGYLAAVCVFRCEVTFEVAPARQIDSGRNRGEGHTMTAGIKVYPKADHATRRKLGEGRGLLVRL
jgi:hypothetical protein